MDCLSSYAMTKLIGVKDRFDIAFANDPDADRLDLTGARNRDLPLRQPGQKRKKEGRACYSRGRCYLATKVPSTRAQF